MPTILDLDGFAHRVLSSAPGSSGYIGMYDSITGGGTLPNNGGATVTFDTSIKRLAGHVCSLKIAEDGTTGARVGRSRAAGTRTPVDHFWIYVTATPSVKSQFWHCTAASSALLGMNTNGSIFYSNGGQSEQTIAGNFADSQWHLVSVRFDTSTTTFKVDVSVDGVAGTQSTRAGQVAADINTTYLGSNTASHTLTVWISDWLHSNTSADHPMLGHHVFPLYPNGEGTETLGTTNAIQDQAAGNTNLWQKVDDWAAGGVASTTDYVTYASVTTGDAASNFAEFTFTDPVAADTQIVGVIGWLAGFANGTAADIADLRILTAHGGTILDYIGQAMDYSFSATVLGYHRKCITPPGGGWTAAALAAVVAQWGYATDTNSIPRLAAVMLEYACKDTVVGASSVAGGGAVASAATHKAVGAASIAGAGAVASAGNHTAVGAASIAGAGSVAATAIRKAVGAASIAGAGAIAATATRKAIAAVSIAGAGAVASAAAHTAVAAAAIAGAGAMAASAVRSTFAAAAIAGAGAIAAAATRIRSAVSAIAGVGSVQSTAQRIVVGADTIVGNGQISASPSGQHSASSAIAGAGAVASAAAHTAVGAAAIAGGGSVQATGRRIVIGSAGVSGQGAVNATANRQAIATALLTGGGQLVATGSVLRLAAATINGAGQIVATAEITALIRMSEYGTRSAAGELATSGGGGEVGTRASSGEV